MKIDFKNLSLQVSSFALRVIENLSVEISKQATSQFNNSSDPSGQLLGIAATSIAKEVFSGIQGLLSKALANSEENKEDEEIRKIISRVIARALESTRKNYLATHEVSRNQRSQVNDFFTNLEYSLTPQLSSGKYEKAVHFFDETLVKNNLSEIIDYDAIDNGLNELEDGDNLSAFFESTFEKEIRYCFIEEIRSEKNKPFLQSFQLLLLDNINRNIQSILVRQDLLEKKLDKQDYGSGGVAPLNPSSRHQLEEIHKAFTEPHQADHLFSTALDTLSVSIKKSIDEVLLLSKKTDKNVVLVKKDVSDIKDWLSKNSSYVALLSIACLFLIALALVFKDILVSKDSKFGSFLPGDKEQVAKPADSSFTDRNNLSVAELNKTVVDTMRIVKPSSSLPANTKEVIPEISFNLDGKVYTDNSSLDNEIRFFNQTSNSIDFLGTVNNYPVNGKAKIKGSALNVVEGNVSGTLFITGDERTLSGSLNQKELEIQLMVNNTLSAAK